MKRCIALLTFVLSIFIAHAQKLVMRGDHADPSVVKIGSTYWASATSSNWFPAYPLLHSKDLINWKTKGYVFNTLPAWADYYFWAPEISYEKGKVYIYYAAHKKGGNLCLAVASADKPEGPYTDHGPLMCEEAGSIDAFPMRDENGKLYLIWKEDGNSVQKPTPIWAMELNEERTKLIGEKKMLFKNELSWEKNLVEGVSMIRHGAYYYGFYAAAGCCGRGCDYVTGVARSKNLLGPWEKYDKNPLLKNNDSWICPGHGTPIEKEGKFYFLYHGYNKQTNAFTGREGLLKEFKFTNDNWVEFVDEPAVAYNTDFDIEDEFKGNKLNDRWQWSVFQNAGKKVSKGLLTLAALPDVTGAFMGQATLAGNYIASTIINTSKSTARAGIAAIGDEKNMISCLYANGKLTVVEVKDGKETTLFLKDVVADKKLALQMRVNDGGSISFSYALKKEDFIPLHDTPVNGKFLPPWDRAVRAGLVSKGTVDKVAVFKEFEMTSLNEH